MNVELLNPVLKSMVDMLAMMAQLEVTPGRPCLKSENRALGEVTGLLRIQGESLNGSVAISFSRSVIISLCQRMLHRRPAGIDSWVIDLAGEIANMIAGGAKGALEDRGYKVNMSLPTVLKGVGHVVKHEVEAKTIVLPFSSDLGELYVEMCFDYGFKSPQKPN